MGNVGWQNRSMFRPGRYRINLYNPKNLTTNLNFKDTWHGALGTQYRPSPAWRFGLGAQYAIKQNLTVGFAYELQWTGYMSINQSRGPPSGTVAGQYDNAYFHVYALTLSWKY